MSGPACTCGCCATPAGPGARPANRPGLTALRYRVGDHGSFLAAMLARLSSSDLPALAALTTRDLDDPSIALLDAWATVADVLTFYQERIANEGYLATATEQRSLLGLGRLVGYEPRPGVSASVYLAYGLEAGHDAVIPQGTRAQSVPGPGELPQTFETSAPLTARAEWNALALRQSRPQVVTEQSRELWLAGTDTRLAPGDMLVLETRGVAADGTEPPTRTGRFIASVAPDPAAGRTGVVLVGDETVEPAPRPTIDLMGAIEALSLPAARPPRDALTLRRDQTAALGSQAGGGLAFLAAARGIPAATLRNALAAGPAVPSESLHVYAMRLRTGLFGRNAPRDVTQTPTKTTFTEWTWADGMRASVALPEDEGVIYLDGAHEDVVPRFLALRMTTSDPPPDDPPVVSVAPAVAKSAAATKVTKPLRFFDITAAAVTARQAYGMSGQATQIRLDPPWLDGDPRRAPAKNPTWTDAIRGTTVYAVPEELTLADEPIVDPIGSTGPDALEIELAGLYDGLEPGRLVIVSGERADLTGIHASELAMIASVRAGVFDTGDGGLPADALAGDRLHTFVTLAPPGLAYSYARASVVISGNVVHATHGETRREVLGSGDASTPLQRFALKQTPLTYVSAVTANGVESTLQVRVDELLWHEAPSLAALGPADRGYIVRRATDGTTDATFGNGVRGARLPTGTENVRAVYRSGIGAAANVGSERITTLTDRPLGVHDVTNPAAATGGADPETVTSARANIPLPLKALDRLVSVTDYADFSRTFAGIGKAAAAALTDGRRRVVHVTVAGADDIPLADGDDVMVNLHLALAALGDPLQPIVVARRELLVLVVHATVWLLPDYAWDLVEPKIRAALLDAYGFAGQELGYGIAASAVISTIQGVPGVDGVDLDILDTIAEAATGGDLDTLSLALNDRIEVHSASWDKASGLKPAQLATLLASVPDTLMLVQR